jgi:septum formation topological specificity factor MinE
MANDRRPATPEEEEHLHRMLVELIDAAIERGEDDITIEFYDDKVQITSTREDVLLGRRGNCRRIAKDVYEVILAPVREHSRKPDEVYARIERYCAGPYLELFARTRHPGWDARGDQVDMFPMEGAP